MRKLYTHPWLIVAVILLITVFFALQLPRAEIDNNNFRFVPDDDAALATSRKIDEAFGSSFFILVGLQRQYGTIFERDFLNRIQDYTLIVQEIPIVRDTTSLINADYITSIGDAIVVEKLVGDDFTGTQEEIAELKRRLLSWDMYDRALFSDDYSATQILIPLTINSDDATSPETTEHIVTIRDLAHEMFGDTATVYVTGMPIIMATVSEAMGADLKLLVPVVILVMLFALFFSFRSVTPVVLPLLTVIISIIWTIGAMPLFGVTLSVISTVLPVILVAVGSGESIHILIHYLHSVKNQPGIISREEHTELVLSTLMKMRRSVFLTALTTFAGFSSFCFTSVAPCREFGYFSSLGVAIAFIITITLVPSLLIIKGPGKLQNVPARKNQEGSAFLADNLVIIARKRKTILFIAALVICFSIYGLSKIIIDNVMIEYFREDTDIYRSDDFIRRQFGGSKVVSVMVESDGYETTLHPDTLGAMDGLSSYLQQKVPNVGKVMGFTDLVKRINQVFNADESPDGLRPSTSVGLSSGSFGFDDFGFDDFGFDDFGFNDTEVSSMSLILQPPPFAMSDKDRVYTQNELLELFDKAGTNFRGMNANDLVWELKRQVNYEGASYYEIPVDPKRYGKQTPEELQQIIANYMVLLSSNINEYANNPLEPSAVKATVQLRTMGMEDSRAILREMGEYIAANFPDNVEVTIGGSTMVEDSINNRIIQNQITSMLFSVLSILIIIAIANKSLAAGLLAMTPLSISILLNFAIMGFAGIKLNLGTSMVGAVSVCVGIDYTIHCLESYKREYYASGGSGDFLHKVFFVSGKAIVINAASVGVSFAVMILSSFVMLADFGALIAFTMFSSSLVSLTVLPALLATFRPKFLIGK